MNPENKNLDSLNSFFNKLVDKHPDLKWMFQRESASYRFYRDKATNDRYFWTTQKINHKGRPKYVAGIYRYLKTKKLLKLVRRVGFSRKYKAKDWAYNQFTKHGKSQSL